MTLIILLVSGIGVMAGGVCIFQLNDSVYQSCDFYQWSSSTTGWHMGMSVALSQSGRHLWVGAPSANTGAGE